MDLLIQKAIESFSSLPSIGSRSAERLIYYFLHLGDEKQKNFIQSLQALEAIGQCNSCYNFSRNDLCDICQDNKRSSRLCVVESPSLVLKLEQIGCFDGRYFVLGGLLSPLDGIGIETIHLDKLEHHMSQFDEVVLMLNQSLEAEMTASFIVNMAKKNQIPISRVAQGVSLSGSLDATDHKTLEYALKLRTKME